MPINDLLRYITGEQEAPLFIFRLTLKSKIAIVLVQKPITSEDNLSNNNIAELVSYFEDTNTHSEIRWVEESKKMQVTYFKETKVPAHYMDKLRSTFESSPLGVQIPLAEGIIDVVRYGDRLKVEAYFDFNYMCPDCDLTALKLNLEYLVSQGVKICTNTALSPSERESA